MAQEYLIKTRNGNFRIRVPDGMSQEKALSLAAATNPKFAQVYAQAQATQRLGGNVKEGPGGLTTEGASRLPRVDEAKLPRQQRQEREALRRTAYTIPLALTAATGVGAPGATALALGGGYVGGEMGHRAGGWFGHPEAGAAIGAGLGGLAGGIGGEKLLMKALAMRYPWLARGALEGAAGAEGAGAMAPKEASAQGRNLVLTPAQAATEQGQLTAAAGQAGWRANWPLKERMLVDLLERGGRGGEGAVGP